MTRETEVELWKAAIQAQGKITPEMVLTTRKLKRLRQEADVAWAAYRAEANHIRASEK